MKPKSAARSTSIHALLIEYTPMQQKIRIAG